LDNARKNLVEFVSSYNDCKNLFVKFSGKFNILIFSFEGEAVNKLDLFFPTFDEAMVIFLKK